MRARHWTKFVRLVRSTTKDDTYGQEEETWAEGEEVWGMIEPVKAFEGLRYGLLGSQVEVTITLRQNPGIKFTDKLRDKDTGIVYEIEGVIWERRKRKTTIAARQFRDQ